MNYTALLVLVGVLSGCTSFQESTYVNYNTPYGNMFQATGQAADRAASAITSNNCRSCTQGEQIVAADHSGVVDYWENQDMMHNITQSAWYTLGYEISNEINTAIRRAFD